MVSTLDAVKYATNGEGAKFREAFGELMKEKVLSVMDSRRKEVAQALFTKVTNA